MNIEAHNRQVYNTIAKHFSDTRAWLWDDLKPLATYVHDGDTVFDVGCGNGRLYQLFASKKIRYIGLDQSEELIKIAKTKFPSAEFLVGDMTVLPLSQASCDVIFCIAAFHHLPDEASRLKTLQEMKRVLKPNGKIIMLNWNLLGDWAKKKLKKEEIKKISDDKNDFIVPWKDGRGNVLGERYYHAFTLDELARLTTMAGLVVVSQRFVKKGKPSTIEAGENLFTHLEVYGL